jgi:hypothetical protein
MTMILSIDGDRLRLTSGAELSFAFPIGDALEFGNVVIVRLQIPGGTIFNENVYGVSSDGSIIWQIQPEYAPNWDAAWGGLENRNGEAVLSNSESQIRHIDPNTGTITRREISVR